MSANKAPGFEKNPRHRIETGPAGGRIRVMAQGELIADTRDAVVLREETYPPVYYFPREDVKMERLVASTHSTYCPYKGHASYYSLQHGPADAAWSYEQPYDEMLVIRGRLAFYPDKVDGIVIAADGD